MKDPRARFDAMFVAIPLPTFSKQLLLNWGVIAVGLLTLYGFTAISLIVVARSVSKLEYGQYLAVFSLTTLTAVLPSFGIDSWLLTQGKAIADHGRYFWIFLWRLRARTLLIWFLLLIAITLVLPERTFPVRLMVVTMTGVAFESLTVMGYAFMRGAGKHIQVTLLQATSATLLLVITLSLPLQPGRILWFAAGRTVLSAAMLIGVGFGLYKHLRELAHYPLSARSMLRASQSFWVTDISAVVYGRADVTLVSLFVGASATSVYGPAVNLLLMTFIPSRALYFFTVPRLTQAKETTRYLFRRQSRIQFWMQATGGALLSGLLLIGAPVIIGLVYGVTYLGSIPVLQALSIITALRSINFALAAPLVADGHQSKRARVQVVAAAFNILMNLAIIPVWGVYGVAVVYILTEILLATGYAYLAWHLLRPQQIENCSN
jgi:O-antigen/teichoic acid export membrane protein